MNEESRLPDDPVIMVVDDTLANLQLLSEMLKQKRFRVRPLPDGKLALQAVQNTPPDLILLDINMPDMNGYEVCERLKADEKTRDIPVIFISALSETMDKIKAFGVGGVDYVTKPFQFEEVVARVETHLELRRQKRALQKSYERLKELERLRDNLAHMIVHDLDNPLGAIQMALELLKDSISAQNADDVRMLHAAASGAARLREMIRQLLDISRMETGQMPLNQTRGNLVETTQDTINALATLASGRQLLLHAPDAVPAIYDAEIIGRIVGNLLGNALKFSPGIAR